MVKSGALQLKQTDTDIKQIHKLRLEKKIRVALSNVYSFTMGSPTNTIATLLESQANYVIEVKPNK